VYQVDKSKQTKTMNAYVNGLGPTKRIVYCTTYKPWEKGEPYRAWHAGGKS
jgi:hypothetical protein